MIGSITDVRQIERKSGSGISGLLILKTASAVIDSTAEVSVQAGGVLWEKNY